MSLCACQFIAGSRRAVPVGALALFGIADLLRDRHRTTCDESYDSTRQQLPTNTPKNNVVRPKSMHDVATDSKTHKSPPKTKNETLMPVGNKQDRKTGLVGGGDEQGSFHGLFPQRQLWQPRIPYPLWDYNWDDKLDVPLEEGEQGVYDVRGHHVNTEGTTRHIIMIRHGQYDETHEHDGKRVLTELGRKQADLTGKRLAVMLKGMKDKFDPCNIKVIRVSDMTRAKETADIIAKHLPEVERADPDPLLNEGIPAQIIPIRPDIDTERETDRHHHRIEKAFRKYFFRAEEDSQESDRRHKNNRQSANKHEFEVIVCHGNVIRYFFCRALQLSPEAWLRMSIFNCSLTYFMIMPTGEVKCRMLGDIGHLGYEHSTFSMKYGFAWS